MIKKHHIAKISSFIAVIAIIFYAIPFFSTPKPNIIDASPLTILQNTPLDGEIKVSLKGTQFNEECVVIVNKTIVDDFTELADDTIGFVLPKELYRTASVNRIYVKRNYGGLFSKTSNKIKQTVLSLDSIDMPEITDVDTAGFDEDNPFVTIKGVNLNGNSVVFANGVEMKNSIQTQNGGLRVKLPYSLWAIKDSVSLYVKQTFDGYITSVKSNVTTISTPVHNRNTQLNYDWLNTGYLVAEAEGGFSRQSFLQKYYSGHRIFKMELSFTAERLLAGGFGQDDNGLPLPWDGASLLITDICRLMQQYPDFYVVTDTKESSYHAVKSTFDNITDTINGFDPRLTERFIVQVYDQAMYYQLINDYGFNSFIYALKDSAENNNQVLDFIVKTGVKATALPPERITPEFVKEINKLGCHALAYDVNDYSRARLLLMDDVFGVYTSSLTYGDIGIAANSFLSEFFLNNERKLLYYLDKLNNDDYITVFSICNEGTEALTDELITGLQRLGLTARLMNGYGQSYLAVVNGDKPIYERVSPNLLRHLLKINGDEFDISSSGIYTSSSSGIKINGFDYSINEWGMNIVVYDKNTKSVVDSVNFDTSIDLSYKRRTDINDYVAFAKYLDDINREGYIIMFSVKDEGLLRINDFLLEKLRLLGLKEDVRGMFRYSYAAVTDGGNVVFESLGEELISGRCLADEWLIDITSGGQFFGDISSVKIDGVEYSTGERGLNIVVFDKYLGKVVSSVCFDTFDGFRKISSPE